MGWPGCYGVGKETAPKVRVTNEAAKDLAKDNTVWLGRVRRFLEDQSAEERDPDRRQDVLHPSELCRDDFCTRAAWYRLSGYTAKRESTGFHLLNIWDEGSDIHTKWQTRLWDMGMLMGEFSCLACRYIGDVVPRYGKTGFWWGTAPQKCPGCGSGRMFLRYAEVPVDGSEYLIQGRADARVGMDLGEMKSIGKGTLRVEAPALFARNTHKSMVDGDEKTWTDLDNIWRSIRVPFLVHRKQAMLYLHFTGLDRMVFLYEAKWNQQVKEFVVPYNEAEVQPMLELAKDVKYALEKGKVPRCPHGGCELCRAYETEENNADRGPVTHTRRRDLTSKARTRTVRVPPSK